MSDFGFASHRGDAVVTVSDAHLLFSGSYARYGRDLIISDETQHLVVPNYFHGDKRPLLVSSDGAPLDSAIVDALTGHTQYAQAGGSPAGKVVGHIAKMTGSASIVRNGVTIDVQVGDAVYQSDVVQTGSGSTLGLVLIDGTAFNLSANARLMLNDLTSMQRVGRFAGHSCEQFDQRAIHSCGGGHQLRRRPSRQNRRHEGSNAGCSYWN